MNGAKHGILVIGFQGRGYSIEHRQGMTLVVSVFETTND